MCKYGRLHDLHGEHANWMQLQGINFYKVCDKSGRGGYKLLMEIVESKCRIPD
jgi:hypothetical protein